VRGAPRLSSFQAGLLALFLLTAFSLGAWFKWNPFADPFVLRADFDDTSNIAKRSPVRIAGIEVGKVTDVEALEGGGGRVTMELSDEALPLKEDAELKVRPRIFLGGNFFVEVEPGTPDAPPIGDGEVIPRNQTAAAVQLTDVIGSLQSDTRADLQTAVEEYAAALDQGGAEGFEQALPSLAPALRDLAITSDAALGEKPGEDIRNGVRGSGRVAGALAEDEEGLKGLVTDLAVTTGALVREDGALEAAIPALRDTLRVAGPALGDVNAAIPTVRVTAREGVDLDARRAQHAQVERAHGRRPRIAGFERAWRSCLYPRQRREADEAGDENDRPELVGVGLWRKRQMDDERERNQDVDAGIRGLEYLCERARRSRCDRWNVDPIVEPPQRRFLRRSRRDKQETTRPVADQQ